MSQITDLVMGSSIGRIALFYVAAFWLAVTYWTYRDAASRSGNRWVAVASALLVLVLFVPGLFIYLVLRPRNTLLDLETLALEAEALQSSQVDELGCPKCHQPVDADFIKCPYCRTAFGHLCPKCSRRLEGAWGLCPYCGEEGLQPLAVRTSPVPMTADPRRQTPPAGAEAGPPKVTLRERRPRR